MDPVPLPAGSFPLPVPALRSTSTSAPDTVTTAADMQRRVRVTVGPQPADSTFGPDVVDWFVRVKRAELLRHDQADDKEAWQAREYFSRF